MSNQRLDIMHLHFHSFHVLSHFLRSPTQVKGARPHENTYNIMVSQVHRAKQFSRYSATRGSRMNGWMQSQQAFVSSFCPKSCDDGPLQACEVLRPVGAEQPQILLLKKDDAGLVKFRLHVVFAIYRGSLARVQGCPRKLKVSKCLGMPAPVDSISRIMAVELSEVPGEKGKYGCSSLSHARLVTPNEDVACEVPVENHGSQNGRLFIGVPVATQELLDKIHKGEVNPLSVFLPKRRKNTEEPEKPDEAKEVREKFVGFGPMDFPKGMAGQKNLKLFFERLASAYADPNSGSLPLLDAQGNVKLGGALHSWPSMSSRCAMYFEFMDGSDKNKKHSWSHGVFNKLSLFFGFHFRLNELNCQTFLILLISPNSSNSFSMCSLRFSKKCTPKCATLRHSNLKISQDISRSLKRFYEIYLSCVEIF